MKNKYKINELRVIVDRLRSSCKVTDVFQIVLYSLYLKYIEMENTGNTVHLYYDEKYTLSYLSLTFGKKVHLGELITYIERSGAIADYGRRILSTGLRDSFYRIDEEAIRIVFEYVDSISFNEKKELYEMAQEILVIWSNIPGRNQHEWFTNKSLSELESKILNCKEGMTVYDGYCGTGISVNRVSNGKGLVYLQDLNMNIVAIATIITTLSGNQVGKVSCGDSLLSPLLISEDGVKIEPEEFDRIVCEPPYMPKYDQQYFERVLPENYVYTDYANGETMAIRHVISRLKDDGVAAVLVPLGILFKAGKTGEIREKLIRDRYIEAVIELPPSLMPGTGITTALLIMRKNRREDTIFMIDAKACFIKVGKRETIMSEEQINRIVELYRSKKEVEKMSCITTLDQLENNGFNLCVEQYMMSSVNVNLEVKNILAYERQYKSLTEELLELDEKLYSLRGKWYDEERG